MASAMDSVRAGIESEVSGTWAARTTIQWPDRPFTPPASGPWLRPSILFADGFPETMGPSALNQVPGVVQCSLFCRKSEGLGAITQYADEARLMLTQFQVDDVSFGVCSGPQEVSGGHPAFLQLAVSAPFTVRETV